jgi:hypothetical protein
LDLLSIVKQQDQEQKMIEEELQSSPLYPFMYALKSSEARRQYPKRLKMLFDYLKLPNSLKEQSTEFLNRANGNDGTHWAQHTVFFIWAPSTHFHFNFHFQV